MSKTTITERREFLKTKVNPILEVMVSDLMKERPDQVVISIKFTIKKFQHNTLSLKYTQGRVHGSMDRPKRAKSRSRM